MKKWHPSFLVFSGFSAGYVWDLNYGHAWAFLILFFALGVHTRVVFK